MRKIYILLAIIILITITGCGYKADPIYVDDTKQIQDDL